MRQTSKKVLQVAASVAKKTASFSANLPCFWWNYQPKMPKSVKKMRKF
ncbi:MAG: cyclic lactone autoinducer peptide [Ruminococcus sp.]|nr:cyclic lactone autoinducer peptide [Ruminococcus sp.]